MLLICFESLSSLNFVRLLELWFDNMYDLLKVEIFDFTLSNFILLEVDLEFPAVLLSSLLLRNGKFLYVILPLFSCLIDSFLDIIEPPGLFFLVFSSLTASTLLLAETVGFMKLIFLPGDTGLDSSISLV